MSSFAVQVVAIDDIETHPDADALEIAVINRYRSVVRKDAGFTRGEVVAYVPQQALLPDYLMRRLGLWNDKENAGKLGGPGRNMVSAVKLRGILSQGICLKIKALADGRFVVDCEEGGIVADLGEDVSEELGVVKWEPVIPPELLGDVFVADKELTVDFDIEDVKAYPDAMVEGEEVEYTEKMHGVFVALTRLPERDAAAFPDRSVLFGKNRDMLLYSKGLGAQGLAFQDSEGNLDSVYVKATKALRDGLEALEFDGDAPLTVMGEVFGRGVQDLHYGRDLTFQMFGACAGYRGRQEYFGPGARHALADALGVDPVSVLYRGPFSWETLAVHTDGKTLMDAGHIREGVVIVPVVERSHVKLGRVIAKSVSEAYLLRKGGTEYK